MAIETIYFQGEILTILPDGNTQTNDDSVARTRTTSSTTKEGGAVFGGLYDNTGPGKIYDDFGLRQNYTGDGYLDINGGAGNKATLSFDAPAGSYTVTLRLANGSTSTVTDNFNRPIALTVDGGAPTATQNTNTGDWSAWSEVAFTIEVATGGTHTLTIVQATGSGAPNIDAIAISDVDAEVNFAAPTISGDGLFSIAENTTVVGTIAATDLDGDALTYALTGADADKFTIDPNGQLAFITPPDFETPASSLGINTYSLSVTVTDVLGGSDVQPVTVTVQDVNEAPAFTPIYIQGESAVITTANSKTRALTQTNEADEGSDAKDIFGLRLDYSGEGYVDFGDTPGDTAAYSVATPDAGTFDLHIRYASGGDRTLNIVVDGGTPLLVTFPSTGGSDAFDNWKVVTVPIVVNSPNTSIELVIPVGRSNGPNIDALAITDAGALPDFAPRFTTLPDFTIADGDTAVGTIGAADVDEDTTDADDTVGPVTFGLTAGGTDNPKFAIDTNSGALSLIAPAVHATQSSYSVEVSATDDAGGVTLQTVTVTVEAPPVPVTVTLNPINFDENAAGATIAEIAITGPDAPYGIGDVTLSDSTNFRVIDDNGALKLALAEGVSLDNEAATLPAVTLTVGSVVSDAFTPDPANVNEAPTLDGTLADASIAANGGIVSLAALIATDPDGDTPTLGIRLANGDPAPAGVSISGTDLTIPAGLVAGPLALEVFATDGTLDSAAIPLTITIEEAVDTPPTITLTAIPAAENLPNAVVADIAIVDPDTGYSASDITLAGADADLFEVIDNTGALQLALKGGTTLDFEATTQPSVTLSIGAVVAAPFSPQVTDVNEAPVLAGAIADATLPATGGIVSLAGLTATDPDGDATTLAIANSGALPAGITLSGAEITVADGVTAGIYTIDIQATDDTLDSNSVSFALTVEEPLPPAPFETIYRQGESLTILPDGNADATDDSRPRTHTENPEQPPNTTGFDEYGLRLNYTGVGYLDINGAAGDKATLSFDAPAGSYTVTLRLANGSTSTVTDNFNRPIALTVDGGTPTASQNTNTGDWGAWSEVAFTIDVATGGTHILTIVQATGSGAPNIDAIAISEPGAAVNFAAPTISGDGIFSVLENTTLVGTIAASDLDGDTLAYNLSGADADAFTIAANGELSFKAAPDFETDPQTYALDVTVTDGQGGSAVQSVTVTVTDDTSESLPQPAIAQILIDSTDAAITLAATNPDSTMTAQAIQGGTFVETSNGNDGKILDAFSLRAGYSGHGYSDFGNDPGDSVAYGFTVTDAGLYALHIRYSSQDSSGSARSLDLGINGAATTMIFPSTGGGSGAAAAQGFNNWDFLTVEVELQAGDNAITLAIPAGKTAGPNVDALALTSVGAAPNFAPVFGAPLALSLEENTTAAGTLTATDVDDDTTDTGSTATAVSYAITGGTDIGKLAIDATSGALTLNAAADFETQASYSVEVTATDFAGAATTQTVTVSVTDLDEAPELVLTASGPVNEDAANAVIATLTASDPEGDAISFEVDDTRFEVVGTDLRLKDGAALDAAADDGRVVTVTATANGLATQESVTLEVTDIDAPVTAVTLTALPVAENDAGAVLADIAVTDPDSTYTAADVTLSGADQALFRAIDGPTGLQLALAEDVSLDFEATTQPSVTVTVGGVAADAFVPAPSDVAEPDGPLTFQLATVAPYTGQDRPSQGGAGVSVSADGSALTLDGNLWKRAPLPAEYLITDETQLVLDLLIGAVVPEIAAIGFDLDDDPFDGDRSIYQLGGTQTQSAFLDLRGQGSANGDGTTRFVIDLSAHSGKTITSLVFVSDDDSQANGGLGSTTFANVELAENTDPTGNSAPRVVGGGVADQSVPEGGTVEIDLPFVDDDGDALTYDFEIRDATGADVTAGFGLTLVDGVLAGSVAGGVAPGVYTVLLTASDGELPAQDDFLLTIEDVNEAPVAEDTAFEPIIGAVGQEIVSIPLEDYTYVFSDPDAADVLTFTVADLPAGLTLNEEGVITGTPLETGSGAFRIIATDQGGLTAEISIDLRIAAPGIGDVVVIEAEDFTGLAAAGNFFATGQAGASEDRIIRANNNGTPSSVTTDLSLNGLAEGYYTVAMTRYDEQNDSASYSLSIGDTVLAENEAFDTDGTFDYPGSFRGAAGQKGNIKTVTFDTPVFVTAGTILTLTGQANGELLRTDKFTFTRLDSPNLAPDAPALDAATIAENASGAIVGTLAAADPDGDAVSFSVDPGSDFEVVGNQLKLKDGVALDHEAGDPVIVGVTATDARGKSTTADLAIAVTDVNEAPSLGAGVALADVALVVGTGAVVDLAGLGASDPDDGQVPVYALRGANGTALPAGFEIIGTDLIVPDTAPEGSYTIEVFATDGSLDSESVPLSVTVGAPFAPITIQAEDGAIALAAAADNSSTQVRDLDNMEGTTNPFLRPDYSGSGYVDYGNDAGDTLSIAVTVPVAGDYDLNIRYASNTARPLDLVINGASAISLPFPSTDPDGGGAEEGFDHWVFLTQTVTLAAGENSLALSIPAGTNTGPNLDRFEITAAGTGPIPPVDLSADEDGNYGATPVSETVATESLDAVGFRLNGVDADIVTFEASTDDGATFAPVTATVDGDGFLVTLDLTAAAGAASASVIFRVIDEAGNVASSTASVTIDDTPVVVSTRIDGADFAIISTQTGTNATLARILSDPSTHETNSSTDLDPIDGLNDGYDGPGYLDINGTPEDKVSFTFDAPEAGDYLFSFRMANGASATAPRPIAIKLGGQVVEIANTHTGSFGTWQDFPVTLTLQQGANTIVIAQTGTGAPNIDSVLITSATASEDTSADEDGNLAAASVAATVAPDDLDAVEIRLTGVDADILGFEVSTDGGATFAPATAVPAGAGEFLITVDLSAFAVAQSAEVLVRVTDEAANQATQSATIAIEEPPVTAFFKEVQLESRAGDITIIDTSPGANNAGLTQPRDAQNPEEPNADRGPDGLWDDFTGTGYLDMGLDIGDAASFEIDAPEAGTYTVTFRYGNGGATDRPMALSVGGINVSTIAFAPTTDWDNWTEVSVEVTLAAGVNTLAIANTIATGPNLDRVTVSREGTPVDPDSEPGPRETIKINIQDGAAPKAAGYLVANFDGYADRGNGLSYGFVTEASATDADGTTNTPINGASYPAIAINERTGTGESGGDIDDGRDFDSYDPRLTGYAHFDLGSYPGDQDDPNNRVAFEVGLENGWYEVTASVGDTGGPNDSDNQLLIEGVLASSYAPTNFYKTELVTAVVEVTDGHLTLAAPDGVITEIQYLEIRNLPDLTPDDANPAPADYARFINPIATAGVGGATEVDLDPASGPVLGVDPTSDIIIGINVVPERGGALLASLNDGSIKLVETLTGAAVPFSVNTTGGFDSLTISPTGTLKEFTSYTLRIDGFQDRGSNLDPTAPTREFQKFTTTFTTTAAPDVEDREVAFVETTEVTSSLLTSVEMSPDGQYLYAASLNGVIHRWDVSDSDGSLSNEQTMALDYFKEGNASRGIIGLVFDPNDPQTLWVSDNYPVPLSGRSDSTPDFSGRISKITLGSGPDLSGTAETYVTGLPRSGGDHVTNSLEFRANPNGGGGEPSHLLYVIQGSNSAMGEADSAWGFRPERLLTAAVLEIDPSRDAPAGGFDVTTEPLPADGNNRRFADTDGDLKNGGIAITSGEFNGKFLHFAENGVASVRETASFSSAVTKTFYDPFAAGAVLNIFAEGQRNGYDLVWHSNGYLYVSANGSANGGSAPNDPDTPANELITGVETQNDYFFKLERDAYSGHPNPLRDKFILNGGNPTAGVDTNEVLKYPVGTQPDPDYDVANAYSLGKNRSPNGAIEYASTVFGNSLHKAVIFTEYSSGNDLRAMILDASGNVVDDFIIRDPQGDVISHPDPLDVIEGADGRLYLMTLDRSSGQSLIVRLDPAPGGEVSDTTADAGNDLAIIVVDATDPAAAIFQINGLDNDIVSVTVSFNSEPPVSVSLNGANRFTADVSSFGASVDANIAVVDDNGNTAQASTVFVPGETAEDYVPFLTIQAEDKTPGDGTAVTVATGAGAQIQIRDASNPETGTQGLVNGLRPGAYGLDGNTDNLDGTPGGYADFGKTNVDFLTFTFEVTAGNAGNSLLRFRYANGDDPAAADGGVRPLTVTVNGIDIGALDFAPTAGASTDERLMTWEDEEIAALLVTGTNTVTLTSVDNDGPNIDQLELLRPTVPTAPNDGEETVNGLVYVKYEAEKADLDGPVVVTEDRNQSGNFVDYNGTADQTITWTVSVAEDGTYALDILYALAIGKAARPAALSVNGNAEQTLPFAPVSNSGETNWFPQSAEVTLSKGLNTIALTAPLANGANIDYLRVTKTPVDGFEPNFVAIDGEARIELEATDGSARTINANAVDFFFTVAEDGAYALDFAANAGAPNGGGLTVFLNGVEIAREDFPGAGEETAYTDLQAGVNYTLRVVSDAPGASAIDYLDVRPAPGNPNADIAIQSLDPSYFDNRLHFSWLEDPNAVGAGDREYKESAQLLITNTGTETLTILETEISPFYTVTVPASLEGIDIAPGASLTVTVEFNGDVDAPNGFPARSNGANGVYEGQLVLRTNDADSPETTVELAAFWQARDEGGWEPSLNEVWQVLGFSTRVNSAALDNQDIYEQANQYEVLSPLWRLADGVTEARITQVAAFHSPSGASIGIHAPGDKNTDKALFSHDALYNQSLFPLKGNGTFTTATINAAFVPDAWAGNDLFSIEVANFSTDPTLNSGGPGTVPDGVQRGHFTRIFQALDKDGNVIPNVFIGGQDYTGINYDYNDNMFVIEGLTPAGDGAVATISGLDDAAADARLVFSRIDNPANSNQTFRDTATFKITNDGIGTLAIDSVTVDGPFTVSGLTAGSSLAVGQQATVTVSFTGTDPADDNAAVLHDGSLVIGTSAGIKSIALAGLAQIQSEGGEEPSVAQIVEALGYSTDVAQAALANGGIVETVGDEVLLPYLQRLDGSKPVEVIQVAAFLSPGVGRLSLHEVTSGALTGLYAQDDQQYQSLLPKGLVAGAGNTGSVARATINRDTPFGLKVTVDNKPTFSAWTDPNANLADKTFNLSAGNEGHYIRFFQAKDASGAVIPGTYIGIQDYPGGENFDYNDHMFVIKNVKGYDLTAAQDANGDGVNDALVLDNDNDGTANFFDTTPGGGTGLDKGGYVVGFNVGGPAVASQQGLNGVALRADTDPLISYTGDGATRAPGADLASNPNGANALPGAFKTYRDGKAWTAKVDGLKDGAYVVVLHTQETYWNTAGQRKFDMSINGTKVADDLDPFVAGGGGDKVVSIEALVQVTGGSFTVTLDAQGSDGIDNAALNAITIYRSATDPNGGLDTGSSGQSPFPGPQAPGLVGGVLTVDASNYDTGGQGVAYNDAAGLQGGSNGGRPGSDVEATTGGDVGWIAAGEWLEYTVNLAAAGNYALDMLLATTQAGRTATAEFYRPGETTPYASTGAIANPSTGSYTSFAPRSVAAIGLEAGEQIVRITFGGGSQDFRSFTLTQAQAPENQAPVTSGIPAQSADENDAFTLDASTAFSDPDNDPLTFSATGLPAGLGISPTGSITGEPTEPGDFTVIVTASDGAKAVQTSFTLSVAPEPLASPQAPFPGPAAPALADTLTVDATNFDSGGQGVSWNDNPGRDNAAQALRADTDVELVGAELDIGHVLKGEWVEYTIDVQQAGTYALSVNAKTPVGGNSISVSLDTGAALASFALPDSNAASDNGFAGTAFAQTAPIEVELGAGVQTLRFAFDGTAASNGYLLDFRSFSLDAVETGPEVIGLAGKATFTQTSGSQWFTVTFAEALDNPSVVMGPLSLGSTQPATMRVRNVTDTGFQFQLDEWDYQDGVHPVETVSWLAVESGVHTLASGAVIEAGSAFGTAGRSTVAFASDFAAAPVVLGQAVTTNGAEAIATRLDDVNADGFAFNFQEQEASDGVHVQEELDWIAVTPGAYGAYAAGVTGDVVTHVGTAVNFAASFTPAPSGSTKFLASMQTFDGSDPATVRLKSLGTTTATVFIEEEKSSTAETNHVTENVGWFAFAQDTLLA